MMRRPLSTGDLSWIPRRPSRLRGNRIYPPRFITIFEVEESEQATFPLRHTEDSAIESSLSKRSLLEIDRRSTENGDPTRRAIDEREPHAVVSL
jgi:hypothetical protein